MTNSGTCPIVGLVGGVGSGKSLLARSLAETFGTVLVDGDAAGHRALADPSIQAALRERFGNGIFDGPSAIVRPALAAKVFCPGPECARARRDLERITHPWIARDLRGQIAAAKASEAPLILLDAAILLEAGWRDLCDGLVFVEAEEALRRERTLGRGWTETQWRQREASQLSLSAKRAHADAIVDNNGPISETIDQFARSARALFDIELQGRGLVASH